MPKAFDNCRKRGGKIRTASGPSKRFNLKAGEYRHYCWKKGMKKEAWGYKKKRKGPKKSSKKKYSKKVRRVMGY